MKIRSFAAYAHSRLPKRLKELTRIAGIIDEKNPEGLDREEAEECLRHFRPHFEDIDLYAYGGNWCLSVGYYCCQQCETKFDVKDAKSFSSDGLYCPRCGTKMEAEIARGEEEASDEH